MWTRIQVLYLAIATILTGALFFCDLATIIGPEGSEISIGYHEKLPYLILTIMAFTAQVACFACIKLRFLQMRVCIIAALLLLGFQVWIGIDFFLNRKDMVFSFTALFPLVAAFLDVLAARSIMLDEMMVQTWNKMHGKKKKETKNNSQSPS
ncbi:MAG: DUF4293 domain-containing protein [Candidatus Cryptobacteroides sp.]